MINGKGQKACLQKMKERIHFSLNAAIGVFTFEVCRERLAYNMPSINILTQFHYDY